MSSTGEDSVLDQNDIDSLVSVITERNEPPAAGVPAAAATVSPAACARASAADARRWHRRTAVDRSRRCAAHRKAGGGTIQADAVRRRGRPAAGAGSGSGEAGGGAHRPGASPPTARGPIGRLPGPGDVPMRLLWRERVGRRLGQVHSLWGRDVARLVAPGLTGPERLCKETKEAGQPWPL